MTVEIKQSDSPEEVEKKLQSIRDLISQKEQERKTRVKSFFGILKREDIDAVKIQRELRDEWN